MMVMDMILMRKKSKMAIFRPNVCLSTYHDVLLRADYHDATVKIMQIACEGSKDERKWTQKTISIHLIPIYAHFGTSKTIFSLEDLS